MSTGILTLFGEETPPEELNAVGKSRAKQKPKEEVAPAAKAKPQPAPQPAPVATPEPDATPTVARAPRAKKAEKVAEKPVTKHKRHKGEAPPDGWVAEKQYYSIGEVSDLFKVNTSHIRFWTNEFDMKVRTTRKGDRLYTPEQIKELRVIHHLVKEKGYTIKGAKEKLKSGKRVSAEAMDLKQSLLQLRNKLLTIRNGLV
jgi:DNA-binding transcriptional MerR regulator